MNYSLINFFVILTQGIAIDVAAFAYPCNEGVKPDKTITVQVYR